MTCPISTPSSTVQIEVSSWSSIFFSILAAKSWQARRLREERGGIAYLRTNETPAKPVAAYIYPVAAKYRTSATGAIDGPPGMV